MMQWVSLTLGPHRGGRRLWMQGLRLAVAGYVPGATYTVLADAVHRTLTLRVAEDGERVVSSKTRGSSVWPVIDLDRMERVFGVFERVQVRVAVGVIVVVVHPHEIAAWERGQRLRRKLRGGEALACGSLSHGGGVLDQALHAGFHDVRVPVWLAWACDREDAYLQAAMERNPVWTDKTLVLHGDMEDFDLGLLGRIEVLVAGLPCTGASAAGKAKNALRLAEEHETAGTPFLAFLDAIRTTQPALIVLENVVAYASTASMAVIRSALSRWGYTVHEHIVGAGLAGTLERRDRLCVLAVTRGFDLQWEPRPLRRREAHLGEVLEAVGPDDPAWKACGYLDAKEARDLAAGKGFRLQLVTETSTEVGTIGRGYQKMRSTEPMLAHPSGDGRRRLLTPLEHARVKGIDPALVAGLSATLAHEMLGQSVLAPAWRAIGRMLGQQMLAWLESVQCRVSVEDSI